MPHRLVLIPLLAALALAACDSDDANPGGVPRPAPKRGPEPKQNGVVLELDRERASSGDTLELTVVRGIEERSVTVVFTTAGAAA